MWCPPISSHFFCLWWHVLYIVLSPSRPPPPPRPSSLVPLNLELVSESRFFNLHASCLQEEEVEEFRVSLSWYRFHPVSVWTSRSPVHPCIHPPPPPNSACCPFVPYPSVCECLPVLVCVCVINPSICSSPSNEPWLKSIIDPFIVFSVHQTVCLSHLVTSDQT